MPHYIIEFELTESGFVYFATWNYYANTYRPWLPHMGSCGRPQAEVAAFAGCAILSSYLVLFIMFYLSTYKKPSAKKALRRASKVEIPTIEETTEKASDALRSAGEVIVEKLQDENHRLSI